MSPLQACCPSSGSWPVLPHLQSFTSSGRVFRLRGFSTCEGQLPTTPRAPPQTRSILKHFLLRRHPPDLVRGYHQVPVRTEDGPKAVISPFRAFWIVLLCMPFGLKWGAQTFQRPVNSILRDACSYLSIWTTVWWPACRLTSIWCPLKLVFQHLEEHGLSASPDCRWWSSWAIRFHHKTRFHCPLKDRWGPTSLVRLSLKPCRSLWALWIIAIVSSLTWPNFCSHLMGPLGSRRATPGSTGLQNGASMELSLHLGTWWSLHILHHRRP